MDVFEAIRTTRAMRRLDPEQPVSDDDVRTILEAALKGPSGGNQQPIRWMVIRDSETKKSLQEIYQRCWNRGRKPYVADPGKVAPAVLSSADHLAENLHLAPVLILACADTGSVARRHDASVYPSVQNLQLAARALGLGTTLTTAHLFEEDAVKALLDIPAHVTTYALVPVGVPLGKWGEAKRLPLDDVSFHDRWGQVGPGSNADVTAVDDPLDDLTIGSLLERAARSWPDHIAYVQAGRRLTWAEFDAEVDAYARALAAWGLKPGERVSLWMGNVIEWVLIELAVIRLGGVIVPVNTALTATEAAYIVGQSDSVLLVASSALRGRELGKEAVAVAAHEAVSVRDVVTVGMQVDGATDLVVLLDAAETTSSDEVARRAANVQPDDIALTLYTSGTTGSPKGVMHSHRVIGNMSDAAERMKLTENDATVMYLPLFHIFALAATLTFMSRGAAMTLMEVFEGGASLDLMEHEKVTVTYGVAPHYLDQIRHPSYDERNLSSIRLCIAAGTGDLVKLVSERMGPAIGVYGMTETTSMTSLGSLEDPLELRVQTVGRTLPRSSVRIVDEHGVDVPIGTAGHLLVKGSPVMQGYYRKPDITAEAIVDGWFHTGDALTMDENGYLRFVARITEMYKVGGENVDPIEVEAALMRHPAVAFASVQPVAHERLGEVGLAHITLIAGAELTSDDLREFAREQLAAFKVPRHIVVVDEMPMTPSGKVRKFLLRDQFRAPRED